MAGTREEKYYSNEQLLTILMRDGELRPNKLTIDKLENGSHLAVALDASTDHPAVAAAITILHTKMLAAKSKDALFRINESKDDLSKNARPLISFAAGNRKNKALETVFNLLNLNIDHWRPIDPMICANLANQICPLGMPEAGSTPLLYAAEAGRANNIRLLRDQGARSFIALPPERDQFAGWTELDFAVKGFVDEPEDRKPLYREAVLAIFAGSEAHQVLCARQLEATLARWKGPNKEAIEAMLRSAYEQVGSSLGLGSGESHEAGAKKRRVGDSSSSISSEDSSATSDRSDSDFDPKARVYKHKQSSGSKRGRARGRPRGRGRGRGREEAHEESSRFTVPQVSALQRQLRPQPSLLDDSAVMKLTMIGEHGQELDEMLDELPDSQELLSLKQRLKNKVRKILTLAPASSTSTVSLSPRVSPAGKNRSSFAPFSSPRPIASHSHSASAATIPNPDLSTANILQQLSQPSPPPPPYEGMGNPSGSASQTPFQLFPPVSPALSPTISVPRTVNGLPELNLQDLSSPQSSFSWSKR